MNLLTQNSKLKKTSKHFNKRVFNFGIPAYKSKSGKVICPLAGECVKYCYAQKGAYIWSNVSPAFEKRLQATMKNDFIDVMPAADARSLRKAYQSITPNVEIKDEFSCTSCGHTQELEVPFGADFFWPDR